VSDAAPLKSLAVSALLIAAAVAFPPASGLAAPLEANPDSALSDALAAIEGAPLALDDAIRSAIEHATEARSAAASRGAAEGAVRRERGAFDPELFGEFSKSSDEAQSSTPFFGAPVLRKEEITTSAGARMQLPIGTELSASLETIKETSNSTFESFVPKYTTVGKIEVTQPLLKGFGPAARSALTSAERDLEAAVARFDDAVLAVRADTERGYWDLYAAERDFAVQQLIFDRASSLLKEADLRVQAGLVGPIQVANARVFHAEQEQALLDREESLDAASDRLATLVGRRPADGHARYRPIDDPPAEIAVEDEEALVARAFAGSRELAAAEKDAESARALERGARWDALPSLDLFDSLGGNGLSGTSQVRTDSAGNVIPAPPSGGAGDAVSEAVGRDFPTWSAGVRLSMPIGLRADRGERARLRAEAERADQDAIAVRRSLEERVRAGRRELVHAKRRLDAARGGVAASREQVRIGTLEYRAGRSTAFELVRLGADLATAQQRYSQALVRTAKAAADLRRLTSDGLPPASAGSEGSTR